MRLSDDHHIALIALAAHLIPREVANFALEAVKQGATVERPLLELGHLTHEEVAALRVLAKARSRLGPAEPLARMGDSTAEMTIAEQRSQETVVIEPGEEGAAAAQDAERRPILTRAAPARYVPLRTIGEGGTGVVMGARDQDLGREIAMKVLRRGTDASRRQYERFLREAKLTGHLEHPNIIPIYDFGELEGGEPYFTMRFVKGRTLGEILHGAPEGEFSLARLLQIFQSVCMGVQFAHDRGVIHRDLKPENIMIGDYGEVLVLDWGLAKRTSEVEELSPEAIPADHAPGITLDGTVVGTPAYMAPEQAEGRVADVDEKTDVYALGAILYEILTRQAPFEGADARTVVDRVAMGTVVPPRTRAPDRDIPIELEDITLAALSRDKARRPVSARALHDQVLRWLEGARERTRRRREAQSALTQGREIAKRYFAVKDVLGRYEEIRDSIAKRFRGHEPVEEKKELWAIEDQIEQMQVQRTRRFADAVRKLASALEFETDNPEARRELAELYWDRFTEAESKGDRAEMDYALATVKFYNDGTLDERIKGNGSLELATTPEGAESIIYEYVERDRILVPEWGRPLGPSPVERVLLPMGSYLVRIKLDGYRDVRRPMLLTRLRDAHVAVRLYTDAQIGSDFVFIPGGPFIFGGDTLATSHRPQKVMELDDYFIGRYPVTAREYAEFLNALPPEEAEQRAPRTVGVRGSLWSRDDDGRWVMPEREPRTNFSWHWDLPAMGLSWDDALAYCNWRSELEGRRITLPTEEQWEKAARGVDGRFYPWGNKFDATYCKNSRSTPGEAHPEPIGRYRDDSSPFGVRDMAGGVREWCATRASSKADVRHLRGGSWLHGQTAARCCSRAGDMADATLFIYGFRLCTTEPRPA
ncbi:MAG: protein kinase domain-containing protein [Planctomycetota bacterium]|jgi:serine/threonine-protein kinase